MNGAPSPAFEIPPEVAQVFEKFVVTEYAYFTPGGEPLCWPVKHYWYPQRGVLAVSTGLAYPNKCSYPKENPKVALLFSDPTGSHIPGAPVVLVQGDATVLDEDMQENLDRYVRELRGRFWSARIGLNPISVRFLDFYLPRLWVEITPRQIVSTYKDGTVKTVGTPPAPLQAMPANSGKPAAGIGKKDAGALKKAVERFGEAVVTVRGAGGYPEMTRTPVAVSNGGLIALSASPGAGGAALTFHKHTLGSTRFKAYMARGAVAGPEEASLFVPIKLVGFFGNGFIFPFSTLPHIKDMRRRLQKELARRGKSMPQLRVPR
jgi:hypothetical protein